MKARLELTFQVFVSQKVSFGVSKFLFDDLFMNLRLELGCWEEVYFFLIGYSNHMPPGNDNLQLTRLSGWCKGQNGIFLGSTSIKITPGKEREQWKKKAMITLLFLGGLLWDMIMSELLSENVCSSLLKNSARC